MDLKAAAGGPGGLKRRDKTSTFTITVRGPRFPRRQCRNTVEILLWLTLVARLTRLVQAEPLDNDKKRATQRTKMLQNMSLGSKHGN